MKIPSQELRENGACGEDRLFGVVVYEDRLTRDRTVQLCDRLVQRFWKDLEIDFSWWRFDYLRDGDLAQLATKEVTRADMVVFSAHSQRELPPAVQSWIEAWLPRRQDRPAALVAFIGMESDSLQGLSPVHVYLREVARRAQMDFLTRLPELGEDRNDLFADRLTGRAGKMTDLLDGILQRQSVPSRWGINE